MRHVGHFMVLREKQSPQILLKKEKTEKNKVHQNPLIFSKFKSLEIREFFRFCNISIYRSLYIERGITVAIFISLSVTTFVTIFRCSRFGIKTLE